MRTEKSSNKSEIARLFGKTEAWVQKLMKAFSPVTSEQIVKAISKRPKVTTAEEDASIADYVESVIF